MPDLNDLQNRIIEFRDARDWKQFHNPKDLSISIALEAAELLEHFQWKTPDEVDERVASHREDIADEMSDILNYLLILAHDLDINLLEAADKKLAKNNAKYDAEKSKGNHKKYTEL